MSLEIQFGDAVIRSAPVVGAAGVDAVTRFYGLSMSDWFYVAAIIYTVIQAWAVIYKTVKKRKEET